MIGILAPGLEGFDRLVKRFDILSRWLYEKSLDELEKAKIKGADYTSASLLTYRLCIELDQRIRTSSICS